MRRAADPAGNQAAYQLALGDMHGRVQAGWLAQRLAAGRPPPAMPAAAAPNGEAVWLNGACDLFSWGVVNVVPRQRPVAAFGSPLFVAAAVTLAEAANRRERRWAEAMSGPQWRPHGRVQMLVSASATWLLVGNQWRSWPHTSVSTYDLVDGGCTMSFTGESPPLRLQGPAVYPHSVLLAYAQYGPDVSFLRAPYLRPLQHTSSPLPVPLPMPAVQSW